MKTTALFTLLFYVSASMAQDHRKMMNKTWDILATKTFAPDKAGRYVVVFPPALKALDKKAVELPGYIIPIKTGLVHQTFLLAVLPVSQCQFCGEGNIPDMVEVTMKQPLNYTDKPVTIKGVLNLNNKDTQHPEFLLKDGVIKENSL